MNILVILRKFIFGVGVLEFCFLPSRFYPPNTYSFWWWFSYYPEGVCFQTRGRLFCYLVHKLFFIFLLLSQTSSTIPIWKESTFFTTLQSALSEITHSLHYSAFYFSSTPSPVAPAARGYDMLLKIMPHASQSKPQPSHLRHRCSH